MMPAASCLGLLCAGLGVIAAGHDLIGRTVPNRLCAAIALLGLLARISDDTFGSALLLAAAMLAVTSVLWRCGWLGGGDVKLLTALCLAMPIRELPAFVLLTAATGAALAYIYLVGRRWVAAPVAPKPARLLARALRAERWRLSRGGPLPYAVAIAAGAVLTLGGAS
jgi:prepilin peptidase CpaA